MGALLGALGLDEATAGSALTDFAKQSIAGDAKSDLSGTGSPDDIMKQLLGGFAPATTYKQPQEPWGQTPPPTQGNFFQPSITGGANFMFNPYASLLGK